MHFQWENLIKTLLVDLFKLLIKHPETEGKKSNKRRTYIF
jgi:hypothetical protein